MFKKICALLMGKPKLAPEPIVIPKKKPTIKKVAVKKVAVKKVAAKKTVSKDIKPIAKKGTNKPKKG